MAINAIAGFTLHGLFLNDFVFPVREYWLASVPIVVVGAPIGTVLCSYAQRHHIEIVLLGLILTELVLNSTNKHSHYEVRGLPV